MQKKDQFKLRRLKKSDFLMYFSLLTQLTDVGSVKYVDFLKQLKHMKDYYIAVIKHKNQLIAAATLFIEYKMIHSCGRKGHIEDVVVDKEYRKKGLGMLLVEKLVKEAKKKDCYKISLSCKTGLEHFYSKSGFTNNGLEMVIYLNKE